MISRGPCQRLRDFKALSAQMAKRKAGSKSRCAAAKSWRARARARGDKDDKTWGKSWYHKFSLEKGTVTVTSLFLCDKTNTIISDNKWYPSLIMVGRYRYYNG